MLVVTEKPNRIAAAVVCINNDFIFIFCALVQLRLHSVPN